MVLPPLMPCPPQSVRSQISNSDWVSCLQAWTLLTEAHLSLHVKDFQNTANAQKSPLISFLTSYMNSIAKEDHDVNYMQLSKNVPIHRNCFLLVHRIFTELPSVPGPLLHWSFLGDFSRVYRHTQSLLSLLVAVWEKNETSVTTPLEEIKRTLAVQLDLGQYSILEDASFSQCLLPLLRACSPAAALMMIGSDLLDSIVSAYSKSPSQLRPRLLMFVYLGLNALVGGDKPNHSLLFDHLYSLKSAPESKYQKSLLSDLVTETPLLSRMRRHITGIDESRAASLIKSIEVFRSGESTRPKKHVRRKIDKAKAKADDQYGHAEFDTIHVSRMSLISQIRQLFPDLGMAFVARLLDEYDNNVELVTAHLLDDTLPPHLRNADRSGMLPITRQQETDNDLVPDLAPHATPPQSPIPERRNVFDNDEFDRLAVDASRLHIGRKNATLTADTILSDRDPSSHSNHKAAILSALAAFDADDDERDDTYDLEDVGATVDTARPGGADEADAEIDDMREKNEEALFSALSMNPELFERDSATRRGQPRQALKSETGMTDEAIEGWAVMIKRDPRRLRKLEAKYSTFTGQQLALQGTAWRGNAGESATEDSETSGAEGGRGGFTGRGRGGMGRGRGGRGEGGNVAGPADDKATQVSRQRKEAHKGSSANHNRRDQRAKKMARAGFPA